MSAPSTAHRTTGPLGDEQLFVRNATGLVREVTPLTSFAVNAAPGLPVLGVATGLFWALAAFPGGNFFVAMLIAVPMMLACTYTFGLLTAAVPRSGGDYAFVSRILHPAAGIVSSFCMTLAILLSNAFFALAFTIVAVGPGLAALGVLAGSTTLVEWGATVQTSEGWQFGLGTAMLVAAIAASAGGWRRMRHLMLSVTVLVLAGFLLTLLISLLTSQEEFAVRFNDAVGGLTGERDSYATIVASAVRLGVPVDSPFSWAATIPVVGVIGSFAVYSYASTFVGGELRRGGTLGTAHRMSLAGLTNLVLVTIAAALFFGAFGKEFMTAAFGGGLPASLPAPPHYFFLAPVAWGGTAVAAFLVLGFCLYWPLVTAVTFLQPTRLLFAYSFDGLLPKRLTRVNERGVPIAAVAVSLCLCVAVFAWAVFVSTNFFQVIVYASLIQLFAMAIVSVTAIAFPLLRPELFRGSALTRRVLGVPLVSLAGCGSLLTVGFLWYLYLHHQAEFGLAGVGSFAIWLVATVVLALAFYFGARAWRMREGVDLRYVYAEIPPE